MTFCIFIVIPNSWLVAMPCMEVNLGVPWQDLLKEAAPHYKKARKYFDGIAKQLVSQGHALDIFACSLDQVGLAEMKVPVEATGGLVVQTDTFHNPVFKESMKRVFARPEDQYNLGLASNATFEVGRSFSDGKHHVSNIPIKADNCFFAFQSLQLDGVAHVVIVLNIELSNI